MAVKGVISRDELGATFERDDGPPVTLYGPAAHSLADEIAASAPPMLADASGDAAADVNKWYGGGANQPPQPPPSVADVPTGPAAQPPPPPAGPVGAGSATRPPMLNPAQAPGNYVEAAPDERPADPAPYGYKYIHGRPGVSQAQWQAKAQTGTALPTSQTVTVEGAIPPNPQIEDAYGQLYARQQELIDHNVAVGIARANRNIAALDKQAIDLEIERDDREYERIVARNRAQETRSKIAEIVEKQSEMRKNPADFFDKRGGTWGSIAAAIAIGLSEYARILTGNPGPNTAMQLIQSGIERESEIERENYERLGDTKNNLVAQLNLELNDLDAAVEAANAIRANLTANAAAKLSAADGRDDVVAAGAQMSQELSANALARLDNVYKLSLGNIRTTTAADVKYPISAIAGGRRARTYEEWLDDNTRITGKEAALGEAQNRKAFEFEGGGAVKGGKVAEERWKVEGDKKQKQADAEAKFREDKDKTFVPGYGYAQDATRAKNVQEIIGGTEAIHKQIDEAVRVRREAAAAALKNPLAAPLIIAEANRKIEAIHTQVSSSWRSATAAGAMDKGFIQQAEKAFADLKIGDPTPSGVVGQFTAMGAIASAKKALDISLEATTKQLVPDRTTPPPAWYKPPAVSNETPVNPNAPDKMGKVGAIQIPKIGQ